MQILLGADPEVFVSMGGIPVSAHGMIPGTKKKPHPVEAGAVQVDGMALEFNIDPSATEEAFVHNLQTVFSKLESMIPEGHRLNVVPSVFFAPDHLKAQPKEALELGCDPDFNAYTGQTNERPDNQTTMRTAAGHVHIGWTKDAEPHSQMHFAMSRQLTRQLDFFLGIPSVLIDADKERRKMYGKAGAFRPKTYGCEYRVLSNFWLKSPDLMKWVFNTTQLAVSELLAGNELFDNSDVSPQDIIDPGMDTEANIHKLRKHNPEIWNKINTFQHLVG